MKRWLIGVPAVLIGLLILLLLITWGLAGTESGTRWLLTRAQNLTDQKLQIQSTEGHLLGDLQLHGVRYETADFGSGVERLHLKWQPSDLFAGLLQVDEILIVSPWYEQYRSAEQQEEITQESEPSFEIEKPLDIQLEKLEVVAGKFLTTPGGDSQELEKLTAKLDWLDPGIEVHQFDLLAPGITLQLTGTVNPEQQFPMDLDMKLDYEQEDVLQLQVQGELQGDLDKLNLVQTVNGDVEASFVAEVLDITGELGWLLDLDINRIPDSMLSRELQDELALTADAQGNLRDAHADITISAGRTKVAEDAGSQLQLSGDIELETLSFAVNGAWERLQWPLAGLPDVALESGTLQATGIPSAYTMNLSSQVQGQDIPDAQLNLEGNGNDQRIDITTLNADVLNGAINATGTVVWAPALEWSAKLQGSELDPSVMAVDWPGQIDLSFSSRGAIVDQQLQANAMLESLQGTLRERPIEGSGGIDIHGDAIKIDTLRLAVAQSSIAINGEIAEQFSLEWQANAPDLADVLPRSKGVLAANGKVSGSRDKPVADGKISLKEAAVQGHQFVALDGEFMIDTDESQPSKLLLNLSDALIAGRKVSRAQASLDGTLASHQLAMDVQHDMGVVLGSAAGSYNVENAAWNGSVDKLQFQLNENPGWQLKAPAELNAAPEHTVLSPLCLISNNAELCAKADWQEAAGDLLVTLRDLDLERFKPLLPPEITELEDSIIDVEIKVENRDKLIASATMELEPGSVALQVDPERQVRLQHKNARLNAKLGPEKLAADWNLEVGEHGAQGEFSVPRKAFDEDPMTAPLQGQVKLTVLELGLIRAFVREIEELEGQIDADLSLAGTLGSPQVKGQAQLNSQRLAVPLIGLEMSDITMTLRSEQSDRLGLNGSAKSGGGDLEVNGEVLLLTEQGWPSKLTIKGDRFQLANVPEATVFITPDIQIETTQEQVRVRGKLEIPEALLQFKDIPAGSQAPSSDVLIVSDNGEVEPPPTQNLDVELTLKLGDKVKFDGLGLEAGFSGQITTHIRPGRLPTANGDIQIGKGSFRAYGQDLTIERGRVTYAGGYLDNPGIQLRASRKISDTLVGVDVSGTAKKPDITAFSDDPDISQADAVSMMLTGQKVDNLKDAQIYTGRQITPDLSVGVNIGAGDAATEFVARYRLRDNVHVEGTSSSEKSGGSVLYTIDIH
ncbi:MAG: translocation/assembly module TamB domain-containing protein [bacterium]